MASHKSALKRIKQTATRTARNRAQRSRLRHQIKELRTALDAKDKAVVNELSPSVFALIDHASRRGILHRNTAARYKSRLSLRANTLT